MFEFFYNKFRKLSRTHARHKGSVYPKSLLGGWRWDGSSSSQLASRNVMKGSILLVQHKNWFTSSEVKKMLRENLKVWTVLAWKNRAIWTILQCCLDAILSLSIHNKGHRFFTSFLDFSVGILDFIHQCE